VTSDWPSWFPLIAITEPTGNTCTFFSSRPVWFMMRNVPDGGTIREIVEYDRDMLGIEMRTVCAANYERLGSTFTNGGEPVHASDEHINLAHFTNELPIHTPFANLLVIAACVKLVRRSPACSGHQISIW
jgi:hypothetical protein